MPSDNFNPLPQYEAVFYRRSVPPNQISNFTEQIVCPGTSKEQAASSLTNNGLIAPYSPPAISASTIVQHPGSMISVSFPSYHIATSNEVFQYHNHVLIGNHLYYILRSLRPNHSDVGKFRLVLVQGTSKGRLRGIKLTQKTIVHTHICSHSNSVVNHFLACESTSTHSHNDVDVRSTEPSGTPKQVGFPTAFMITVNGVDAWGREQANIVDEKATINIILNFC